MIVSEVLSFKHHDAGIVGGERGEHVIEHGHM